MRKLSLAFSAINLMAFVFCNNSIQAQWFPASNGNHGIGTNSPNTFLEVRKIVPGGLGPVLRLTGGGEIGGQSALDLATFDPGGNAPAFRMIATDIGNYSCRVDFQIKTPGNLGNGLENKMSLTENGYLGIGVANPQSKLHVQGHLAAANPNSDQFVQLWADNAIIWKAGTQHGGLRFGSATDLNAANYSDKMRLMDNGNLGIGTNNPTYKLHVEGNGYYNGNLVLGPEDHNAGPGKRIDFGMNSNSDPQSIGRYNVKADASELRVNISDEPGSEDRFVIGWTPYNTNNYTPLMHVNANGIVGIGATVTTEPGYKLFVAEGIRTRKVKVDGLNWADYVFHSNYRLRPLSEVEQYIKANGHLPEVPSEEEVKKEGIDLGNNQATLLKKIEELTLYVIEQNKRQDNQEKLIQEQRLQLKNQQERLVELEKQLKEKVTQ